MKSFLIIPPVKATDDPTIIQVKPTMTVFSGEGFIVNSEEPPTVLEARLRISEVRTQKVQGLIRVGDIVESFAKLPPGARVMLFNPLETAMVNALLKGDIPSARELIDTAPVPVDYEWLRTELIERLTALKEPPPDPEPPNDTEVISASLESVTTKKA